MGLCVFSNKHRDLAFTKGGDLTHENDTISYTYTITFVTFAFVSNSSAQDASPEFTLNGGRKCFSVFINHFADNRLIRKELIFSKTYIKRNELSVSKILTRDSF